MKNKGSVKQDKQQNNGVATAAAASTSNKNNNNQHNQSNNQTRNNKQRFKKMNRPLKRLNPNNKNARVQQRENRKIKKMMKNQAKPSFLDALSEYKRIRGMNKQNAPSTSKDNQENLKAYESVTVISDDDLEDGEIIEDKVSQYVNLISESFKEVERSKMIKDKKSPDSSHENQPIFYVDKSADSFSEVPLYTSLSDTSAEKMDVDNESVIVINDTMSNSDDSVIVIEDKTPIKPHFAAGSDFISLSPISHELQKSPELTTKERRRERQKARINKYKQRKMVEKVLELQSNGLLEGIGPIKVPLALNSAASFPPLNSGISSTVNMHAIPKPVENSTPSSSNSNSMPSTSQNIPSLSEVVQSMIRPVQTVSINPPSLLNVQFRPQLNGPRMPQVKHSTPLAVQEQPKKDREKRKILIDGSNVAMGFTASEVGKKAMSNDFKEFSAEALKQVVKYFEDKGFQVKAVVPEFRVRRDKSSNHPLMVELLEGSKLITTPSKSYDDLILLESAAKLDAAIVSNDLFRDIKNMKKTNRDVMDVIEKRQIRYNWVFGEFILADDPYGRAGPKLDDILFK